MEAEMINLKGRSILGINELNHEEIEFVLEVAHDLKRKLKMGEPHEYLRGKSLAGIFGTQSTRTSCSFEVSMQALGGHMLWLGNERIWAGSAGAESWHDTIKTISRFMDGIAYRPVTRERLEETRDYSTVPVINASCPVEHPTQAFADMMTMQEYLGHNVKGAKVAFLWGYTELNPPAGLTNSMLAIAPRMGFDLTIGCPEGMDPDPAYIEAAKKEAAEAGIKVEIVRSYEEAVKDADFVEAYSWVSPAIFAEGPETGYRGNPEFAKYKETLKHWIVDDSVMAMAPKRAKFMHPLPVDRDSEVASSTLDGPQSVIFDQAENRMHTIKALLTLLLR